MGIMHVKAFKTTGVVRSDFIELLPGSGADTDLGYFDFHPDGTVTFTPAIPEPSAAILSLIGAVLLAPRWRSRRK